MMNYILDFIKNFEQIKTIFKSTKKFPALLWVFLSTLSFILLFLNMLLSDKIKDMFTLFNISCLICFFFSFAMLILKSIDELNLRAQKQKELEEKHIQEEEAKKKGYEYIDFLFSLPPERAAEYFVCVDGFKLTSQEIISYCANYQATHPEKQAWFDAFFAAASKPHTIQLNFTEDFSL